MEMVRRDYEEDLKYNTGQEKGPEGQAQGTRRETRCLFLEGRWPAQHRPWRRDWLGTYFERDFIGIFLRMGVWAWTR